MNGMDTGASMKPVWVVAGAVGLYMLLATAIRCGKRKQRPIMWLASLVIAVMVLCPPWLREKGEWGNASKKPGQQDSRYILSTISVGYGLIWSPPKHRRANTGKPAEINWQRLLVQIGVVAVLTGTLVFVYRTGPILPEPEGPRGHGAEGPQDAS